jgi:putative transposase
MTKADSEFLYKGRYPVETTRLKSWDYSNDGWYFVTICTKNRMHFFGEVVNDEMQLSEIGKVAVDEWVKTSQIRPDVTIDSFVVMPNHVHAVVVIQRQQSNSPVETRCIASLQETTFVPPSAAHKPSPATVNQFGPLKKGSLQSIVRGYKSAVTTWCKKNNHAEFGWQERYWDHIIRSEESLINTRQYLINNPLQWALDKENAPQLWM